MRQWITPRSLMLHALFILVAGGCLFAGWWQVHRAMQGNTLSYLYSVEWPAFAVVAGIGWWQMFHDTPQDLAARREFHEKMRAASTAVVARTLPRSARAITVEAADAGARRLTTGGSGRRAITAGGADPDYLAGPDGVSAPSSGVVPADGADLGAVLMQAEDTDGEPTDPMAAYNRYLATLALRGKPKTWRNPRGL